MFRMGLIRIVILACLLMASIIGAAARVNAAEESSSSNDDARLAAITEHLADITVPDVRLEFEAAGPRLPYEELPGGSALVHAAYFYAISTGDFAVSYADLMDKGYWPFDVYDVKYRDYYLYVFSAEPPLYPYRFFEDGILGSQGEHIDAELMVDTSTAIWTFHTRTEILDAFYRGYFEFYEDDTQGAVSRLKPCETFWEIDHLVNPDGTPVGSIEEEAVSAYLPGYHSGYRESMPNSAQPENPLDPLVVKCFRGDLWLYRTNSGYDSQYREQMRSKRSADDAATPSRPPA